MKFTGPSNDGKQFRSFEDLMEYANGIGTSKITYVTRR
jgi:hypothetical protein